MRAAEQINLVYFAAFVALAWLRLRGERRLRATVIGAAGLGLTLASIVSPDYMMGLGSATLRDWLPAPLMLLAYWQAGQFFVAPNEKLQAALEDFDRRWLAWWTTDSAGAARRWLVAYLEFAYLFCYPAVPLALGALYLAGQRDRADEFWRVVLPASYFCYAMVPFLQTWPPRVREEQRISAGGSPILRGLNLIILRRASIHANTFPSAHVAASLAAALAVMSYLPRAGIVLLLVALSIAAGAVLRRYHFALDAIVGAATAILAFLLWRLAG